MHCSVAEQTIKLALGHAVAFAGSLLQAVAIDDRDDAALIADEAPGLAGLRPPS
jgi:hypothetical protein